MKKIITVVASLAVATSVLGANLATPCARSQDPSNGYIKRHQHALKSIRENETKKFDLVMCGDSITHFWDTHGANVRDEAFSGIKVLNCGHSGDKVQELLWRLADGELDGYSCPLFQVLIGTNNRLDTAEDIAAGIKAVVSLILEKHPESKVLLIPILPRSDFNPQKHQTAEVFAKLQSVNDIIKPLADGDRVVWFDLGPKFSNPDGTINESLFRDHLHPNEAGYRVWAEALKPYINKKETTMETSDTVYQFTVKGRKGEDISLAGYKGKVLLIVNTATRCGFTPQYEGMEAMYERLKDKDFELLDFPCNQFGQQAPGTDEEIHSFCVLNYKTAFPQFAKVDVNGEGASPLFKFLVANTKFAGFPQDGKLAPILEKMLGEADADYAKKPDIKWNFTKFLIGRDGKIIRRFEPTAPLPAIEAAINDALEK